MAYSLIFPSTILHRPLLWLLLIVGMVTGCSQPPEVPPTEAEPLTPRIISLDFCADQYVVELAERESVMGLSPQATAPFSYVRERALAYPQIAPRLETILALKPTLVVRTYGGGPQIQYQLEQLGIAVLQIPFAEDLASIQNSIHTVAKALGRQEEGLRLTSQLRAKLAPIQQSASTKPPLKALYFTAGGVTPGTQGLINELLTEAGLANYSTNKGWQSLPLERLVREKPDLTATAFFEAGANPVHYWSKSRHPLLDQLLGDIPSATLSSAWVACGGWFVAEAIAQLHQLRLTVEGEDAR